MKQNNWKIIVNPHSGNGKGRKYWNVISDIFAHKKIVFSAEFTKGPLDAVDIVLLAVKQGYKKFIVIGGDGTLNEVVHGLFSQTEIQTTEFVLGMISVGTGNDWVRTHNIPFNLEKSIDIILQGNLKKQDIGVVTYYVEQGIQKRYFANVAGIGFDALVALKANKKKQLNKFNAFTYFSSLLSTLINYKHVPVCIQIDDKELHCELFSMNVGIGKYNGCGMKQLPQAICDDGWFEIMVISKVSKFYVVRNTYRLYTGTLDRLPPVKTFKGKTVVVTSKTALCLEADGESLGFSPFSFELLPQALTIIVP